MCHYFTWKWRLDTHREIWVNSCTCILINSCGSITSKISSISFKNITSLGLLVFGQNLNRPRTTSSVNPGSFSRNCTTQYASCGWYRVRDFALCKGISTLVRKSLCSSFKGRAKPLMMLDRIKTCVFVLKKTKCRQNDPHLPRISSNSAMPLCLSSS